MLRPFSARLGASLLLFLASGCLELNQRSAPSADALRSRVRHLPASDEVALVNGIPLTLTRFLSIFEALPLSLRNVQRALDVGASSLLIQERGTQLGSAIPEGIAVRIALYGAGALADADFRAVWAGSRPFAALFSSGDHPTQQQVSSELSSWLGRTIIQKNESTLRAILPPELRSH